jgi:hypothetical protein
LVFWALDSGRENITPRLHKRRVQITDLPEYRKGFPRIWGDKVYVHMFQGATNGIYQFELPPEETK